MTVAGRLIAPQGTTLSGGNDNDHFVIHYPTGVTNTGIVFVTDIGGIDAVLVSGTELPDVLTLTTEAPTDATYDQVTRLNATNEPIRVSNSIESLRLNGLGGNDTFNVQPSRLFSVVIDGGAPTIGAADVPPGDHVNLDTLDGTFAFSGSGLVVTANGTTHRAVTPVNIENLLLSPVSNATVQRYDFNGPTSATQSGFTSVTPTTLYSPALGYGWNTAHTSIRNGTDSSSVANLINDGLLYSTATSSDVPVFTANFANGWAQVTIVYGHPSIAMDGLRIVNVDTGEYLASNLSTDAGERDHVTLFTRITDGTLNLRFEDVLGNRMIVLNSLELRPAQLFTMGLIDAPESLLSADPLIVDTFHLGGGPSNLLVTIEPSLGSVVGIDADPQIDGFQVQTNAAGSATVQLRRPSLAGTSTVMLTAPTGERWGCVDIAYGNVLLRDFDFNTRTSATQMGYLGVATNELYSANVGYGWLSQPDQFILRTPLTTTNSDLLNDGHRGSTANTFRVDLANGTYNVRVLMGDSADHNGISLAANGVTQFTDVALPRDLFIDRTFDVTVTNGQLDLMFSGRSGIADPSWIVNALEIRAIPVTNTITPSRVGEVPADGFTITPVTAASTLADGALVTVSSTLGTITSTDRDAAMAGIQVAVGVGGFISFDLRSPVVPGTPTITWTTLNSATQAIANDAAFLNFVVTTNTASVRRFDFNRGSSDATMSPTAAGYTGVRSNHLNAAVDGFGWISTPSAFNSPSDPPGISPPTLFRDGHRGQTGVTGTFQVQASVGTTYDLRVYVGQFGQTLDQVRISAEGANAAIAPSTNWDQFVTVIVQGVRDTNSDGLINIQFADLGGSATGWSIVGLDIATTAQG